MIILNIATAFAQEGNHFAAANLSVTIPEYLHIKPLTSPVLTAAITDRTGYLQAPLNTTFRITTNTSQTKTLYLQANTMTDSGLENSMFTQGNQVYIAFGNIKELPSLSAITNCKMGAGPNDSPGVVAYPVMTVRGVKHSFLANKDKYELYVDNGTTDVTIDVGQQVLKNSFGKNDPKGFYQTIISITEVDI